MKWPRRGCSDQRRQTRVDDILQHPAVARRVNPLTDLGAPTTLSGSESRDGAVGAARVAGAAEVADG